MASAGAKAHSARLAGLRCARLAYKHGFSPCSRELVSAVAPHSRSQELKQARMIYYPHLAVFMCVSGAGAKAQSPASTHENHVCTRGLAQRKPANPSAMCFSTRARARKATIGAFRARRCTSESLRERGTSSSKLEVLEKRPKTGAKRPKRPHFRWKAKLLARNWHQKRSFWPISSKSEPAEGIKSEAFGRRPRPKRSFAAGSGRFGQISKKCHKIGQNGPKLIENHRF